MIFYNNKQVLQGVVYWLVDHHQILFIMAAGYRPLLHLVLVMMDQWYIVLSMTSLQIQMILYSQITMEEDCMVKMYILMLVRYLTSSMSIN